VQRQMTRQHGDSTLICASAVDELEAKCLMNLEHRFIDEGMGVRSKAARSYRLLRRSGIDAELHVT